MKMGLQEDFHLVGTELFPWLTTCIYIAILVVEYPINLPLGKFLGSCIMIWGAILALHAATTTFTHLVIVRTLLGAFEAVCQPTFLVMSSMW
jgi:hypothetical protein